MNREDMTPEQIMEGYTTVVPFINYDLNGRVTGTGSQGLFAIQDFARQGHLIMPGEGHWNTHYVDLEAGEVRERVAFTGAFDRDELPVRQEAVLADVPACLVTYDGPVSGSFDHPGGDLEVGFTVPGVYRIELEAFPCLPVLLDLVVTP